MNNVCTIFVNVMFHITQFGKYVDRFISSKTISSSQDIDGRVYKFETRTVKYIVHHGKWWLPVKISRSIMVQSALIDVDGQTKRLGTKEYPIFVPSFLVGARYHHVLARRQYMNDVGQYLGHLRSTDR